MFYFPHTPSIPQQTKCIDYTVVIITIIIKWCTTTIIIAMIITINKYVGLTSVNDNIKGTTAQSKVNRI